MSVRRSIALGFAVAVLLGGCQGDPEPKVEPTPSESSSETSPTSEPEEQTAEEFIRAWVALDAEMQNTGDTEKYLAVSRQCAPCKAVADRVERAYMNGGYLETDGWRIDNIREVQGKARYRLTGRSTPTTIVDEEGAEPLRLAGGPITYDLVLRESADGWQVVDLLEIAT